MAAALSVAAPAQADPTAGYVPAASDIIGVGSDTSEFALNYLADGNAGVAGYNAASPANKLVSWNALAPTGGPATDQPRRATPSARPNGSGQGKAALYGAGNVPDVDFARSSSAPRRDREVERRPLRLPVRQGRARPRHREDVQRARDHQHRRHGQDLLRPGDQLEPARRRRRRDRAEDPAEPARARGPSSCQLKAANGGNLPSPWPTLVAEVQEHDPPLVQDNPNAVAPFSVGRNAVSGAPLRIEGGFTAAPRALQRRSPGRPWPSPRSWPCSATTGFVCSAAAKPLIEAAGFEQLAGPARAASAAWRPRTRPTNLRDHHRDAPRPPRWPGRRPPPAPLSLTATCRRRHQLADGLVRFYLDGSTTPSRHPGAAHGRQGDQALPASPPARTRSSRSSRPSRRPTWPRSPRPPPVTVPLRPPRCPAAKASTKSRSNFKKSLRQGREAIKGTVKVKESATGKAAGKVVIKLGKKTVGKGTIKNGVATVKLTKPLKKGKNKLDRDVRRRRDVRRLEAEVHHHHQVRTALLNRGRVAR